MQPEHLLVFVLAVARAAVGYPRAQDSCELYPETIFENEESH